ncbi:hypothetical protein JW868_02910 [Candidatus Woesearchaeota archaeon]|nr:hypothetical protein [Candidatus Woesearchaeota archaeon]
MKVKSKNVLGRGSSVVQHCLANLKRNLMMTHSIVVELIDHVGLVSAVLLK